jgi:hypothetical protein
MQSAARHSRGLRNVFTLLRVRRLISNIFVPLLAEFSQIVP